LLTEKRLTAVDYARLSGQVNALRALEKRTALFVGWLKMERSTKFQAGVGRFLGPSVKNTLLSKVRSRRYFLNFVKWWMVSGLEDAFETVK
jgi:hypothetical protein